MKAYSDLLLDYQKQRDQAARFYITLLIAFTSVLLAIGPKVSPNVIYDINSKLAAIAFIIILYFIIAISWIQKIKTLNALENAVIKDMKQNDTQAHDFFSSIDRYILDEKKKTKFSYISTKLSSTDEGIPDILIRLLVIFLVTLFIIISVSAGLSIAKLVNQYKDYF